MENQIIEYQQQQVMNVNEILTRVSNIQHCMEQVMQKDVHYGVIPGCGDMPTLLKPGAEKLAMMFRLNPSFEITDYRLESEHREYDVICKLYSPDGALLGSGVGCASTMESKYRYRTQSTGKDVPPEYWKTKDQNLLGGSNFSPRKISGTWKIFERIEHDNPADYYNTVKKIAKKRAFIDGILTVTGASDMFTQDVEDMEIPKESATPEPDKQTKKDSKPSITERTDNMVKMFGDYGITKKQIEAYLKHPIKKITEKELAKLGSIYTHISSGQYTWEELTDQQQPPKTEEKQENNNDAFDPVFAEYQDEAEAMQTKVIESLKEYKYDNLIPMLKDSKTYRSKITEFWEQYEQDLDFIRKDSDKWVKAFIGHVANKQ